MMVQNNDCQILGIRQPRIQPWSPEVPYDGSAHFCAELERPTPSQKELGVLGGQAWLQLTGPGGSDGKNLPATQETWV